MTSPPPWPLLLPKKNECLVTRPALMVWHRFSNIRDGPLTVQEPCTTRHHRPQIANVLSGCFSLHARPIKSSREFEVTDTNESTGRLKLCIHQIYFPRSVHALERSSKGNLRPEFVQGKQQASKQARTQAPQNRGARFHSITYSPLVQLNLPIQTPRPEAERRSVVVIGVSQMVVS